MGQAVHQGGTARSRPEVGCGQPVRTLTESSRRHSPRFFTRLHRKDTELPAAVIGPLPLRHAAGSIRGLFPRWSTGCGAICRRNRAFFGLVPNRIQARPDSPRGAALNWESSLPRLWPVGHTPSTTRRFPNPDLNRIVTSNSSARTPITGRNSWVVNGFHPLKLKFALLARLSTTGPRWPQ